MTGPDVFALPHLSEDAVAAFADGVLSAAATSRARRHCSECPECAGAVRIQREAAMFLRCAPAPAMPAGLLDRLSGLPMSAPLPPPRSGLPTVLGADGVPMFVAYTPGAGAVTEPDEPAAGAADPVESVGKPARTITGEPDPDPLLVERRLAGPGHRRASLPLTMLASAAAVVAAGALGGQVSAFSAAADLPSSSTAVQLAPADAAGAFAATPIGQRVATTQSSAVQPLTGQSAVTQHAAGQPAHQLGTVLNVPGAGYRLPVFSLRTAPIQHPGAADGRFTPAP